MSSSTSHPRDDGLGPVVYRTEHDGDDLTTSVLVALDSLPDFDAEASEEVLFSQVDPDALDALFRTNSTAGRTSGRVSFTVGRYHVSASAAGEIVIRDRRP